MYQLSGRAKEVVLNTFPSSIFIIYLSIVMILFMTYNIAVIGGNIPCSFIIIGEYHRIERGK